MATGIEKNEETEVSQKNYKEQFKKKGEAKCISIRDNKMKPTIWSSHFDEAMGGGQD